MKIPGLDDILVVVKKMPEQFDALVQRLDAVIELSEESNALARETNELLRSGHRG